MFLGDRIDPRTIVQCHKGEIDLVRIRPFFTKELGGFDIFLL